LPKTPGWGCSLLSSLKKRKASIIMRGKREKEGDSNHSFLLEELRTTDGKEGKDL